jgi:hypothetical protein
MAISLHDFTIRPLRCVAVCCNHSSSVVNMVLQGVWESVPKKSRWDLEGAGERGWETELMREALVRWCRKLGCIQGLLVVIRKGTATWLSTRAQPVTACAYRFAMDATVGFELNPERTGTLFVNIITRCWSR